MALRKPITYDEARLLSFVIDQDCTGRISHKVFKEYILPQTNVDLRSRLEHRVN